MTSTLKALVSKEMTRARAWKLPATLTVEEWHKTLYDFDGLCAYCQEGSAIVVEHFIPLSKGGGTTAGNCLPSCRKCNQSKHGIHPKDWLSEERYAVLGSYLAARSSGQDIGTPIINEPGWTIRMPRELSEQIKARAAELTARGQGKWTGNMVAVAALIEAAKTWSKKEQ